MKKLIFLITLLFIPFMINASAVPELDLSSKSIHDEANLFDNVELNKLNRAIKRFELNSGIKFYLITVKNKEEIVSLINTIYDSYTPSSYRKDDDTLIMIYHDNSNFNLIEFSNRKYNTWNSNDLRKFSIYYLSPVENGMLSEYHILTNIEEWTKYFQKNNMINIIISSIITLFFTLIILKKIQLKYDYPKVIEVSDYINEDRVIVK